MKAEVYTLNEEDIVGRIKKNKFFKKSIVKLNVLSISRTKLC